MIAVAHRVLRRHALIMFGRVNGCLMPGVVATTGSADLATFQATSAIPIVFADAIVQLEISSGELILSPRRHSRM
jgi:hypothetical protein